MQPNPAPIPKVPLPGSISAQLGPDLFSASAIQMPAPGGGLPPGVQLGVQQGPPGGGLPPGVQLGVQQGPVGAPSVLPDGQAASVQATGAQGPPAAKDTFSWDTLSTILEKQHIMMTNNFSQLLEQVVGEQQQFFQEKLEQNQAEQKRELEVLRANFFSSKKATQGGEATDGAALREAHLRPLREAAQCSLNANHTFKNTKLGSVHFTGQETDFVESST